MGDAEYEKLYIAKKKEHRLLHSRISNSREIQEIYHKIMGLEVEDNKK